MKLQDIQKNQEQNDEIKHNNWKIKIYYKKVGRKEKIILSEEFSKIFLENINYLLCHIGIKHMRNKIKPFYTANTLTRNIKRLVKPAKPAFGINQEENINFVKCLD